MAKLTGPLHSISASGSVGPRLTFSTRKSGPQVRIQKANTDAQSATQLTQRGYFQDAISWWHLLTPTEQAEWVYEGNHE